ncbi:hypothetical phage protein [Campylobacter phage CP220]|uniref:Hypothetical phage protein n=1 Tax=Campylobacter phage CP220 TaxID=2994044 RepID=D5GVA9_9CAUD|nr:hypothetical protein APL47_gp117 [Campylobacter phage CP220]CBJ93926.1 hypothetical phage protein [Campylobacter phage CP220]
MRFLEYHRLKEAEEFSRNDIKTIVKQYNKVFTRILNTKFYLVNEVEYCTSNGSKLIGIRFASTDGYMIRFNYTAKNAKQIQKINKTTKEFHVESIDFWNPITGHLNKPSIRVSVISSLSLKYFIEDITTSIKKNLLGTFYYKDLKFTDDLQADTRYTISPDEIIFINTKGFKESNDFTLSSQDPNIQLILNNIKEVYGEA